MRRYKELLLIPFIHLLFFFLLFLFLTIIGAAYYYGITYSPEQPVFLVLLNRIPPFLKSILPLTVLGSLFMMLFYFLKHPINRFFTITLPLISGSAIYILFFFGLSLLYDSYVVLDETYPKTPFTPGIIHIVDDGAVVPFNVDHNSHSYYLQNIIINSFSHFPGFSYHSEMEYRDQKIISKEESYDINPPNPYYSVLYTPPDFMVNFKRDISYLYKTLTDYYHTSFTLFILTIVSQVLLVISCINLICLSKWPLFSILLGVVIFRFIFFLFYLIHLDSIIEISSLIPSTIIRNTFPIILLFFMAIIIILFDIILNSRSKHA